MSLPKMYCYVIEYTFLNTSRTCELTDTTISTIRYGTIRDDALYLHAPKSWQSQLNLLHGTKQKIVMKKTKTKKRDAQKKRSSHKAMESVLRPGRESMVGKICERGRSWAGRERERELWMVRVVSWQGIEHEQEGQRRTGKRLTEITRKLIPETRWGIPKGTISYT